MVIYWLSGEKKKNYPGRIARQSPKSTPTNSNAAAQLRHNRRNNAKQAQMKKRNALVSATRLFSGVDGAPRIVAVIPLTEDISSASTVKALAGSIDAALDGVEVAEKGIWKMRCVVLFHPVWK
jgi:pre-rRNA-processing protein TSR1